MEDEASFNRSTFATPSVDPLDAVLERLEAERAGGQKTEPEPEKDEETVQNATAEDAPEDDDFEDDDDTDEANTPENDAEDEDEDSQESEQSEESADKPSKLEGKKKQAKGTDSDDSELRLSRKQRGKLIEEIRQELQQKQEENERLQKQLDEQSAKDAELDKEVSRALGTDEEYEKATQDGLDGDTRQAERAKVWKANRAFFQKLVDKANRKTTADFMDTYWSEVKGLPGMTVEALKAPNLSSILKNVYDAGVTSVRGASTDEIEKLKSEVDTWKGRYKSLKAKAGATKQSPLGGGGSTVTANSQDWRKKYIDPKTGLFTDEADAIVAQYGIEALSDPNFRKR